MIKNQDKPEISLYDWLVAHDLLEWTKPLWQSGGWKLRLDGKLHFDSSTLAIETPWRHIKQMWELDCATWHRLIFDYISSKMGPAERFVPSGCLNCWKTVVKPKTLKQLFALENLQIAMDVPSKCGIEVRNTVHGLYGGYFYSLGQEAGLHRYKQVRQAVTEDKHLGPEVPVILKRGCTEFELAVGPSDQWQVMPGQVEIERLVDKWVARDDLLRQQPDILVWYIHRKWIEFAYSQGDATYAEFTGGKPLTRPYVTYHHIADDPSFPNNLNPSDPDQGIAVKPAEENEHVN